MTRTLIRMEDGIARLEEIALFASLMSLVATLFLQVLFRFALEQPLDFTEELSRILLIWTVFLGAARGLYTGEHFLVDFIFRALPAPFRRLVGPLIDLATIAFLAAVVWVSWRSAMAGALQTLPVLGVSVTIQTMAMPVGTGLMTFHGLMLILRRRLRAATEAREGDPATTGEEAAR